MEGADTTVAKGATSIYFSNVTLLGINTAYFIVIANLLSTTAIGVVAGIQLILFGFATIANLSLPQTIPSNIMLPQAVAKFVPEFLSRGERGKAVRSFTIVFFIVISIATVLSLLLYVFAEPVSETLFQGEAEVLWIQLLALDTWLFSMGQLFFGGLVGLKMIPRASLYLVVSFSVRYILGALLVAAGLSILGLLIAFVAGDILFLILTSATCIPRLWGRSEPVSTRLIVNYSLPLMVASLIIFGVTQLDKVFAFLQLGLSELGIYNVAVTASIIGAFAPNALTTALVPTLSSLEAENKMKEFRELAQTYTRYVALIATPMAFGISSLATSLIQLFGPQYLAGAFPAAVMSAATGVTAVSAVYNGELLATRRTRSVMLANVAGLGVLSMLLLILTPILGFVGVAWARSFMTIIVAILLAYTAHRRGLFAIDSKAYRDSLVSSSIMGVALFLILSSIGGYRRQILSLPILIPAGVVIYLGVLRALKTFQIGDIEFLRRFLPKRLEWLTRIASKITGVSSS